MSWYVCDDGKRLEKKALKVARRLGGAPGVTDGVRRVWLDTFDGRLHLAGYTLVETREGELRSVRLMAGDTELALFHTQGRPRVARDLPGKKQRRPVTDAVGVRALMPRLRLVGRAVPVEVEGTTPVLVLSLEAESDNGRVRLPLLAMADSDEGLCDEGFVALEGSVYELGLRTLGQAPAGYSNAVEVELSPYMRSDEATRAVLRQLWRTVCVNEQGVRDDIDSEFLHDYRVAIRRTRAALGQMKGVFDPVRVAHFREEFRWVGRSTSATRDLDVHLLAYGEFQRVVGPKHKKHLKPLRKLLQSRQRHAHGQLLRELERERYARLRVEWAEFLAAEPNDGPALAASPVRQVARVRIGKLYRRVLRDGRAIGPESPPLALHELRKIAKRLRYLLEFYRSVLPATAVRGALKQLRALQDHLGAFQDLEVQVLRMHELRGVLAEEGAGDKTLRAVDRSVQDLERRHALVRLEFAEVFRTFDARGVHRRYTLILDAQPTLSP